MPREQKEVFVFRSHRDVYSVMRERGKSTWAQGQLRRWKVDGHLHLTVYISSAVFHQVHPSSDRICLLNETNSFLEV